MLSTERLLLRSWNEVDINSYYKINQDPKVIEFLPSSLSIAQVKNFIDYANRQQEEKNYTLWAVEHKEDSKLIGFIGLNYTDFAAYFTPAVEIGWRLSSKYWNKGYATEGAEVSLKFAFDKLNLKEIISFTAMNNLRSRRVMEKIGLNYVVNGDFNIPSLPVEHKLSKHVLYKLSKKEYLEKYKNE
jgi:RimJ/RimL family protein N-acetyltransferase